MRLSNAVWVLCSLSSLMGAYGESNSALLRHRTRNDQEDTGGDQQLQQGGNPIDNAESPMIVVEPELPASDMPKAGTVIPGSYIVQIRPVAVELGINVHTLAESLGVPSDKVFEHTIQGFVIENATESEIAEIAEMPEILSIEPDTIVTIQTDGRPPVHRELFERELPYGVERVNGGRRYLGTKVAWVVDTGIDRFHLDLNVDADRGKSFVTSGELGDGSTHDTNGHGTHVAGIIAAKGNPFGVTGVAAGATVIPIKVLGGDGSGSMSAVIQGIDYIVANANPGDVINLSLGGGATEPLDNAIIAASNAGILVAVAAGNQGVNARNTSPARANAQNIYTVSAIDSSDNFASFSNFGNPPVDFAAPGVGVLSTYLGNSYAELSGTSMASPHMAGVLLHLGANRNPSFRGLARQDKDNFPDRIVYLRVFGDGGFGGGDDDDEGGGGEEEEPSTNGGLGSEETPQSEPTNPVPAAADPTNRT